MVCCSHYLGFALAPPSYADPAEIVWTGLETKLAKANSSSEKIQYCILNATVIYDIFNIFTPHYSTVTKTQKQDELIMEVTLAHDFPHSTWYKSTPGVSLVFSGLRPVNPHPSPHASFPTVRVLRTLPSTVGTCEAMFQNITRPWRKLDIDFFHYIVYTNPPTRFGVHSLLFLRSIQNFVTRCPSKIPSPKSKIQNPQNPKSPKSKIQNPQIPKSKLCT